MALMAGEGCWFCGQLVSNRRPRVVQVWNDDGQSAFELVCEACWGRVRAEGEASLDRSGHRYVVRCMVTPSPVVSSPDGAGRSSP